MKHMSSEEIRRTFVDFMVSKAHTLIPSASLVPHGDPTLLFTSAGMVPFKPYFMGLAEPPASRAFGRRGPARQIEQALCVAGKACRATLARQ